MRRVQYAARAEGKTRRIQDIIREARERDNQTACHPPGNGALTTPKERGASWAR